MRLSRNASFFVILFFLFSAPTLLSSQTKTLTIEKAVMGRWGELRPKSRRVRWIHGSDQYWYTSTSNGEAQLITGKAKSGKEEPLLSLSKLNSALEKAGIKKLSRFPRSITWSDAHTFRYSTGSSIVFYDTETEKCTAGPAIDPTGEYLSASPDGMTIAYGIGNNLYIASKSKNSAVTNDPDPNMVYGQSVSRSELGITGGTFWSPDGSKLAFYKKDESNVTDYPLVDIETTPATVNNIKYPMAGMKSEKVAVGVYDINSGKTIYLKTQMKDPEQYLPCVTWGPDGKYLYLAHLNRDHDHCQVAKYEAVTGKQEKTLFEEKDKEYVEPEHQLVFLPGKSDEFLWFSERDGYKHLYHYKTDGTLIRQVTSGSWVASNVLGFDETGEFAYVEGTGANPTESHCYKVEIATGNTEQLTKEAGTHHCSLSTDGKYLVDQYSSLEVANTTQILSAKGKVTKVLHTADNPLEGYKIGKTQIETITAADGKTTLYARKILPPNFDESKKYPVLVYVYGGPRVQLVTNSWLAGAPLWMHHMAAEGYIVYTVDSRGSDNRGIEFEQATFRNLGDIEMADQLEAVKHLKSLPYVDPDRMAIHGWSFGGFMTTTMMLRAPGTFKVGVAGGPVINWEYYEIMFTEKYMDHPENNPEGYKKSNLTNYVDQLEGDLMMIHGTVDDVVVMQHNLSFLKKCVDEGVQVDFFVYPGHPHNVMPPDRVHLMEKVLSYIKEKL